MTPMIAPIQFKLHSSHTIAWELKSAETKFSDFYWGAVLAQLDSHNPSHDYLFKRRKDNVTSILSAIDQPDTSNGTSALSLRTLHSSQKRVPLETQLQQGEERETYIPLEEENHDMLGAQGNGSRTTVGVIQIPRRKRAETMVQDASWRWNKCKFKREKFNRKSINEALNSRPTIIPEDQWRNAVQFRASTPGRARIDRNLENQANYESLIMVEVRASQDYIGK
ncbi:hypothetical protein Cgig2_000956 [Carnegiea gigantea]|uniref:Uncharacterized protein n=1 Tax=Carnegiea gigantea TaxID=171969 RepID=A0A9Q1KN37_9CARY|nr:hypothetical protein Cgig2_000956 [Carnegiea gigantea]